MYHEIDKEALRAALDELAEIDEAIEQMANDLAETVRSLTPVGETGHAVESIEVVEHPDIPNAWRVQATSPKFHLIEFGTGERETKAGAYRGEMPAFAPFFNAADATGKFHPHGNYGESETDV